ncbi:hypothetical protein GGQ74_002730 [Desulfobaculum xiamenense]|uniref:Glycosyltransferase 2-like domain-containing protein n=1 Tax=Desulfobaculum xiamenense TaxID=995050 RepID=A0A846QJJ0_9BACT|nr:glycosyltransferase family 2 protein [Desulfobaculum xiamenense]NJB69036.1 hypothetical protein [Desulfobaculum xiamenense]
MPAVSVCIPVHGQWALTRACLEALRSSVPGRALEVVVADNASTDETPVELPALGRALFGDDFIHLRSEDNPGFAISCNRAAAHARSPMLFFLNNDTVPESDWLAPLLEAFSLDARLAAVAPLLVYPNSGRVQHCGIAFDPFLRPCHLYEYFPATHPVLCTARRVQALSAAALMMPTEFFRDLGGFHEGYVNGYEDMDLCLSMRRRGMRLACVPESRIGHYTSRTPGRFDRETANAALFRQRCAALVRSDLHRHFERDGFALRFTAWGAAHAALSESARHALDAVAPATLPELEQALDAAPLWERGYELFAEAARREGEPERLVDILFLRAFLLPSIPALEALADVAAASGDAVAERSARESVASALRILANPAALRKRMQAVCDAADRVRDAGLAAACRQWLAVSFLAECKP